MAHLTYAEEVGNWLDTLAPWDFWCTFTYRYPPSLPAVRRSMERFAEQVDPSLFFWGSEAGPCTGRNHVHGLFYFDQTRMNFPPSAQALWRKAFNRMGRSHVDQFDKDLGASHYVSKYVSKSLSDWDLISRPR